jgi:hypothetical protein
MILIKNKKTFNLYPLKKEKIFTSKRILTKIELYNYNKYNEKYSHKLF